MHPDKVKTAWVPNRRPFFNQSGINTHQKTAAKPEESPTVRTENGDGHSHAMNTPAVTIAPANTIRATLDIATNAAHSHAAVARIAAQKRIHAF